MPGNYKRHGMSAKSNYSTFTLSLYYWPKLWKKVEPRFSHVRYISNIFSIHIIPSIDIVIPWIHIRFIQVIRLFFFFCSQSFLLPSFVRCTCLIIMSWVRNWQSRVTANLYARCKYKHQWTRWDGKFNSNDNSNGDRPVTTTMPLPQRFPKCKSIKWNRDI